MELECLQLYQDWVENIKQESTFFSTPNTPDTSLFNSSSKVFNVKEIVQKVMYVIIIVVEKKDTFL